MITILTRQINPEDIDEYSLPKGAQLIVDGGSQGQLFLMSDADYEKMLNPQTTLAVPIMEPATSKEIQDVENKLKQLEQDFKNPNLTSAEKYETQRQYRDLQGTLKVLKER